MGDAAGFFPLDSVAEAGMVSGTVTVWTRLPEVPVTVTVYDPAGAEEPTAMVSAEDPLPVIETGENEAVTPDGMPVAVSPITE
jgi:hypothetical protein